MPAVVAEGLVKSFGNTKALCGVDFDVERGQILGVLGPNGAGKTTAVRILTTLLRPDAGRAEIDGIDVLEEPQRARAASASPASTRPSTKPSAATRTSSTSLACTTWAPRSPRAATELLERFDLVDAGDRVVKGYSGGMRRRLDIAMSLIARPSVLFLDEPTTGLDPRSRQSVWALIDELVRGGTTTLLTTQYLDEADRLADDIVVIDQGKAIARGTSEELKQQIGGELIEVVVEDPGERATGDRGPGAPCLRRSPRRRRQANGVAARVPGRGPGPGRGARARRRRDRRSRRGRARRATPRRRLLCAHGPRRRGRRDDGEARRARWVRHGAGDGRQAGAAATVRPGSDGDRVVVQEAEG